jgi:hypothetical protein
MATQTEDLRFGLQSEETNINTLQTHLKTELCRRGGYSTMDFSNKNNTIYVELKSRRIDHNKFDTAIIGANKVDFCKDDAKTYYFVFCYTDGIYYIKFDRELFSTFKRQDDYWRGFRRDCVNRAQRVVHIPVNLLMKID